MHDFRYKHQKIEFLNSKLDEIAQKRVFDLEYKINIGRYSITVSPFSILANKDDVLINFNTEKYNKYLSEFNFKKRPGDIFFEPNVLLTLRRSSLEGLITDISLFQEKMDEFFLKEDEETAKFYRFVSMGKAVSEALSQTDIEILRLKREISTISAGFSEIGVSLEPPAIRWSDVSTLAAIAMQSDGAIREHYLIHASLADFPTITDLKFEKIKWLFGKTVKLWASIFSKPLQIKTITIQAPNPRSFEVFQTKDNAYILPRPSEHIKYDIKEAVNFLGIKKYHLYHEVIFGMPILLVSKKG